MKRASSNLRGPAIDWIQRADPAMNRVSRHGSRAPGRRLRGLAVSVGAMLFPALASAAPTYQLHYGNPVIPDTSTTTPQRVSHASADTHASYAEECFAIPGRAMARVHMSAFDAGNDAAGAQAITDDFIITGPPGPGSVSATVYFVVHLGLGQSGDPADARDASGHPVAAGLYVVRLEFEGRVLTRRMTRLK
jgi:hypothetical protein